MSMNLSLRAGKESFEVLLQTPSTVTRAALASSDPFEVYATWVRELFAKQNAERKQSWDYDELEPDPAEEHLKHVEVVIAFTGAKFVMV